MTTIVSITLLAVFAWSSLWFAAAAEIGDATIADTAWGLGGGVFVPLVGIMTVGHLGARSSVVVAVAAIWGLRLAWHVERRRRASGSDRRYAELRRQWGLHWRLKMFTRVFLVQGAVLIVVTLPIQAALGASRHQSVDVWLVVGAIVAIGGLILETVADRQLATYLRLPTAQRPAVLDSGTWGWSRHPNYTGEAMVWWGLGLAGVGVGTSGLIALLGPAVLTYTLRFATGVPTVEEHRRSQPAYQQYMARVPAMVPVGIFRRRAPEA